MAIIFATLAFTDAVKAMQEKAGSRASYARMERDSYCGWLDRIRNRFYCGTR